MPSTGNTALVALTPIVSEAPIFAVSVLTIPTIKASQCRSVLTTKSRAIDGVNVDNAIGFLTRLISGATAPAPPTHSRLQKLSANVRFSDLETEGKNAKRMSSSVVGFVSSNGSDESNHNPKC